MPRIIVTADPGCARLGDDAPVLLDEQVRSVHLSTDHAAAQLVERLAWAVSDAEKAEQTGAARSPRAAAGSRRPRRASAHSAERRAVRA